MKELSVQLTVVNPFSIQFQTMGMMVNILMKELILHALYFLDGTSFFVTSSRTVYFND